MANTTYHVEGMTCAHCVSAVTKELTALPGVTDVTFELNAGRTSGVSVASTVAPTEAQVAGALGEAGDYQLIAAPVDAVAPTSAADRR